MHDRARPNRTAPPKRPSGLPWVAWLVTLWAPGLLFWFLPSGAVLQSVDARVAALTTLAVSLWILFLFRVEEFRPSTARLRWSLASILALGLVFGPGNVFFASVRSVLVLAMPLWTAWKLRSLVASSPLLVGSVAIVGLLELLPIGFLLAQTQLGPAPVRLFHSRLDLENGETEISFQSADGITLRGSYSPGRPGAGAVVLVHGISDGRSRWSSWVEPLQEQGLHVLRYDLRGHGRSDGAVITLCDLERADLNAAVGWLVAHAHVSPSEVTLVGASMGGGVVLASLPTLHPRAALVLAPASDYEALVAERLGLLGPFGPIAFGLITFFGDALGLPSLQDLVPRAGLSASTIPLLVLHGNDDATVPLSLSERLIRESPNARILIIHETGHADLPDAAIRQGVSRERVLEFIRTGNNRLD